MLYFMLYLCSFDSKQIHESLESTIQNLESGESEAGILELYTSKFDSFRLKFIQKIQGIQLQLPPLLVYGAAMIVSLPAQTLNRTFCGSGPGMSSY